MYSELFAIVSPIFICILMGLIWSRVGVDYSAEFITNVVMNIGAPCLFISVLSNAEIQLSELVVVFKAVIALQIGMLIVGTIIIKLLKYKLSVYLPPLLFPNNGNMGLSLCLFTFGEKGLALGLGIFMFQTVSQFTLGIILVNENPSRQLKKMADVLKQPIIYAAFFAVCIVAFEIELPRWAANTTRLLGGITIPLMLITLGVSLGGLKVKSWHRSLFFSCIRMFGGLLIGFGVVELFDLTGIMRGVVLIQSAMPVAVFNYLLALKYRQEPAETASMIVVSTVLAMVGLPILLAYVLQ